MLYLNSIKIKKEFRSFPEGTEIKFKPGITLLVGDQGVGKSSLIYLLAPMNSEKTKDYIEIDCPTRTQCFFLDTEKDNPRHKGRLEDTSAKLSHQLFSMRKSHGETMFVFFEMLKKAKDAIIFIDEPESGLSIRSQYKLAKIMKEAMNRKVQFIVSTHSFIFMEEFNSSIYDLEIMNYTTLAEFLERQKNVNS